MSDKTKKKFMTAERKSRILTSALLAVGVPLLLFIVIPLELWCNNISELNYHISDVLFPLLCCFFACAVIIFCALFFVPEKLYRIFRVLVIGGGLMIFLQSSFLNVGISGLLGDEPQTVIQRVGIPMVILNAAIWLAVISGCVVASYFIKRQDFVQMGATLLAVVICLTQVVGVVVPLLTTDFSQKPPSVKEAQEKLQTDSKGESNNEWAFLTDKNLTTVGKDRNVVIFVIDRMDEILYTRENLSMVTEYMNDFGGFTYFKDNMSRYGHTYPSLVYMLTKQDLGIEEGRREYFKRAYTENDTLTVLDSLGYSINLYTDGYYGYYNATELPEYVDNIEKVSADSIRNEVENKGELFLRNISVVLARVLPHALKDFCPKTTSAVLNSFGKANSDELTGEQASTEMKLAYDTIKGEEFLTNTDKRFTMIHVSGCHHVPYNENWEVATGAETENVALSLRNSLEIMSEYIADMKRLGVYDKSTIIITGDHGTPISDYTPLNGVRLTSLFVKPSTEGADVEMKTSTAQVSHENLWATIFQSEGIEYAKETFGDSVFDVDSEKDQERKYIWHTTHETYIQYEYIVKGDGSVFENWKQSAKITAEKGLYD